MMKPAVTTPTKSKAAPKAALELNAPLTGKARQLALQEEAKARALVAADAQTMDGGKASSETKAGFISRAWRAITTKPDKSEAGLWNATREAIRFCDELEWISADKMCEELEEQIATALNVQHGVVVEFVAVHKDDRRPRLLVFTTWGLRIALRGPISFGAWPKA